MQAYKIQIKNIDTVQRVFHAAPLKMTQEINRAIQTTVRTLERNIKKEAPVNKQTGGGTLRQSIRSEVTGIASGKVEANAKYASAVETGTRPHIIRVKNKKALANKRTGQVFGRVVRHPGTKANPFFERGIQRSMPDIDRAFVRAVQNVLK